MLRGSSCDFENASNGHHNSSRERRATAQYELNDSSRSKGSSSRGSRRKVAVATQQQQQLQKGGRRLAKPTQKETGRGQDSKLRSTSLDGIRGAARQLRELGKNLQKERKGAATQHKIDKWEENR
ncbi:hypothetical protein CDL15_Pgr027381 [Punica granatum]|uniref:Uncharacterized protein n=1 Tax=Punica granatum TaxID=22663 RepID=A0A218Y0Z7_PUNGR|nr:hypothetical protein CDL15_Pgr027381 [Punica granatum]